MDILHINSNYLTSKLHENLLDHLGANEMNHTIFMPMKSETIGNIKFQSKYNVINPVSFKNRDKFFFTIKQYKIMKELNKSIDVGSFDLIHAHTLFTDGNVAYQLNKNHNIPYIVTVRGDTDVENFFKYRINLRNLGRKILMNAKSILFLSPAHRDKMIEKYIKDPELKNYIINNSIILPNGIDTFWFDNEYTSKKESNLDPVKIISVGVINKRKNQLVSIQALKKLEEKYKIDAELTLVGKIDDIKYAKEVKSQSDSKVTMIGNVGSEELKALYRDSHIFLLPSERETFGLVYPEAMSQGLPILYTKGQGIDGYFEDGQVGYNILSDSPEDIADKIYMVVNNYEKLSANALELFKQFNWEKIALNLQKVYNQVLQKEKKSNAK